MRHGCPSPKLAPSKVSLSTVSGQTGVASIFSAGRTAPPGGWNCGGPGQPLLRPSPNPASCPPGPAPCSGNSSEPDTLPALEKVSVLEGEGCRNSCLQDLSSNRREDRNGQEPGGGRDWPLEAPGKCLKRVPEPGLHPSSRKDGLPLWHLRSPK